MAKCHRCGDRDIQSSRLRLCRRCERETGADVRTMREREGAKVEANRVRLGSMTMRDEGMHPPWRILDLALQGRFYVVWDGSDPYETPVEACRRFRLEAVDE